MGPENILIKGKSVELNNYNQIVDSIEFQKWFLGSVVVDEKGEPLVVYHSTNIRTFRGQNLKRNEKADDWNSFGIFFSSDMNATRNFFTQDHIDSNDRFDRLLREDLIEKQDIQKEKEEFDKNYESITKTFSCFLSIKNPLILNNHQELMELSYSGTTFGLLKEKYDGIIITHDSQFTDQYIVFNSDQIYMLPSLIK